MTNTQKKALEHSLNLLTEARSEVNQLKWRIKDLMELLRQMRCEKDNEKLKDAHIKSIDLFNENLEVNMNDAIEWIKTVLSDNEE